MNTAVQTYQHNHLHITTNTHELIVNRDPSRTTVLRNAFVREAKRRFRHLRMLITKAIVDEDVFGLKKEGTMKVVAMQTPGRRKFAFPRTADKLDAFMNWLKQQEEKGILQLGSINQLGSGIEDPWTNKFILDSYRRGAVRARSQLVRGGFDVPTLESTGGLGALMSTPLHIDRVGLLFTRVFNELKGITDAMDQQISRVLSQGLADGLGPSTLARQLNAVIKGTGGDLSLIDTLGRFIPAERRAEVLARTEIIRAHAEAQLQEFKNWKVAGVTVKAEWVTAGDNRVCQQCADLEGSVFTIDQARNMIPLHPQCRCAWIPFKVTEENLKQEAWRQDAVASNMKSAENGREYFRIKQQMAERWKKWKAEGKTFNSFLREFPELDKTVNLLDSWQSTPSDLPSMVLKMKSELMEKGVGETYMYQGLIGDSQIQKMRAAVTEFSDTRYFMTRAIFQVRMEAEGIKEMTLYRGVRRGIADKMIDALRLDLKRTSYTFNEGSLAGYSSSLEQADKFGAVRASRRFQGITIRRVVKKEDIFIPDLYKVTRGLEREKESIIFGQGKEKVRMKDMKFNLINNDQGFIKDFTEGLSEFFKRIGL